MTQPLSPELVVIAAASRQLAEVHRVAQEKLGLAAGLVAFTAFEEVNVLTPTTQAAWYARIVSVTIAMRRISRRLAARYYNLARAIETRTTFPDIDGVHKEGTVPMSLLYQEMTEVLNEVINITTPDVADPTPDVIDSEIGMSREDRLDEIDQIIEDVFTDLLPEEDSSDWLDEAEIEDWDWGVDESDDKEFLAELEDAIQSEAEKLAEAANDLMTEDGDKVSERVREVLDKHADIVAGTADQGVMVQGRNVEEDVRLHDKRVKAYYRVTGSNPCAFCAMLASRGAVYYSKASAGGTPETAYHLNCHCRAIAIWLNRPFYTKRDIYFITNWKKVTEGKSAAFAPGRTSDAYKAWRSWLYQQYKKGLVPEQDDFAGRPLG